MYSSQEWWSSGADQGGGGDPGDPIDQSLRFRGNQFLERTVQTSSPTNTPFTISFWIKRGSIAGGTDNGATSTWQYIYNAFQYQGQQQGDFIALMNNDKFTVQKNGGFGSTDSSAAGQFRDPGAWYHLVWALTNVNDTPDGLRFYVNNVQLPNLAFDEGWNECGSQTAGCKIHIGDYVPGNGAPGLNFEGYIADFYAVDGQYLDPTAFGRYNDAGVWVPVDYSGSFGSNGFHLDFADPNDIGADRSGNDNHFTATGFDTAPVGIFSGDITTNSTFSAAGGPTTIFDGNTGVFCDATGAGAPAGQEATVTWAPSTPITGLTSLFVFKNVNAYSAIFNGVTTSLPTASGWAEIPLNGATEISAATPLTIRRDELTASLAISAFGINGQTALVDNTGTGYDLMQDSPTQNYAVQNPLGYPGGSSNSTFFTDANLNTAVSSGSNTLFYPSFLEVPETGKYKFEMTSTAGVSRLNFASRENIVTATAVGGAGTGNYFCTQITPASGGFFSHGGTLFPTMGYTSLGANNNYVCLIDADNKNVYVGNGTNWLIQTPINSPSGLGVVSNGPLDLETPTFTYSYVADDGICVMNTVNDNNTPSDSDGLYNYGQVPFQFDHPGFEPLQTQNMPAAPIANGRDHFRAITGGNTLPTPRNNDPVKIDLPAPTNGTLTSVAITGQSGASPRIYGIEINGQLLIETTDEFSGNGQVQSSNTAFDSSSYPTNWVASDGDANNPSTNAFNGVITAPSSNAFIQSGSFWFRWLPTTPLTNVTSIVIYVAYVGGGTGAWVNDINVTPNSILFVAQNTFPNGLWWIKDRVNSNQHQFVDSVRGGNLALRSPNNDEVAYTAPVGDSVAWCWNLVDGRSNGFDIVTYAGDGSTSVREIPHNLSAPPEMMIIKNRTTTSWQVYHSGVDATNPENWGLWMDVSNSRTAANWWGNAQPGADNFTVQFDGSNARTNGPVGTNFVAYCWHSVPGYSAFGSFTGNNSAEGPFIYTGFRPAWIMFKPANQSNPWQIIDSSRDPVNNGTSTVLQPNEPAAENISILDSVDILSNGFKIRDAAGFNQTGWEVTYAAFAENPVQSPTTAR